MASDRINKFATIGNARETRIENRIHRVSIKDIGKVCGPRIHPHHNEIMLGIQPLNCRTAEKRSNFQHNLNVIFPKGISNDISTAAIERKVIILYPLNIGNRKIPSYFIPPHFHAPESASTEKFWILKEYETVSKLNLTIRRITQRIAIIVTDLSPPMLSKVTNHAVVII